MIASTSTKMGILFHFLTKLNMWGWSWIGSLTGNHCWKKKLESKFITMELPKDIWKNFGHVSQTSILALHNGHTADDLLSISGVVEQGTTILAQAILSNTQRQACLAIAGAIRTTPTAAMEGLLGQLSLHIYFFSERAKWATYRLYNMVMNSPLTCTIRHTSLLSQIRN